MSNYGEANLLESLQTVKKYCVKLNGYLNEMGAIRKRLKPLFLENVFPDKMSEIFFVILAMNIIIWGLTSLLALQLLIFIQVFLYSGVLGAIFHFVKNKTVKFIACCLNGIALFVFPTFFGGIGGIICLAIIIGAIAAYYLLVKKRLPEITSKINSMIKEIDADKYEQLNKLNKDKNIVVAELKQVTSGWFPSDWNKYLSVEVLDFFIQAVQNRKANTMTQLVNLLDDSNFKQQRLNYDRQRVLLQKELNEDINYHNKQIRRQNQARTDEIKYHLKRYK